MGRPWQQCEVHVDGRRCELHGHRQNRKTGLVMCNGHHQQMKDGIELRPIRHYRSSGGLVGRACPCCGKPATRYKPDDGLPVCTALYLRLHRRGFPANWRDGYADYKLFQVKEGEWMEMNKYLADRYYVRLRLESYPDHHVVCRLFGTRVGAETDPGDWSGVLYEAQRRENGEWLVLPADGASGYPNWRREIRESVMKELEALSVFNMDNHTEDDDMVIVMERKFIVEQWVAVGTAAATPALWHGNEHDAREMYNHWRKLYGEGNTWLLRAWVDGDRWRHDVDCGPRASLMGKVVGVVYDHLTFHVQDKLGMLSKEESLANNPDQDAVMEQDLAEEEAAMAAEESDRAFDDALWEAQKSLNESLSGRIERVEAQVAAHERVITGASAVFGRHGEGTVVAASPVKMPQFVHLGNTKH